MGTRQPPFFGQGLQPGAKLPPPTAPAGHHPVAGTPPSPPAHLPSPALPEAAVPAEKPQPGPLPYLPAPKPPVPFTSRMPGPPYQPVTPVTPYAPGASVVPPARAQQAAAAAPAAVPVAAVPKPAMVRPHSAPAFVRDPAQPHGNLPPAPAALPPPPATSPAPSSTPEASSPVPGRTPLAARSAPDEGRVKVSEKSIPRVEFVPPVEYVDVSSVFIRFVQFLFLCELSYYLCGSSLSFMHAYILAEYIDAFGLHTFHGTLVASASISLAVLFVFRTICGLFAINFTTAMNPNKAFLRLMALIMSRLAYGAVIIVAGFMLKNEVASDTFKELIKKNVAHLIRYATKEPHYMEEINRIQQEFQCCGTRTDIEVGNATYTPPDHPWNMWFATYSLDETYPNIIRELYSLPWSCCNMTAGVKCEHIGISRYLRRFKTPTDYNDVEAALLVKELNWNPAEFDHYLPRAEIAKGTLYTSDCSVEMFHRLEKEAESLQQLMFNAGTTMIGLSLLLVAVTAHLCLIVRSGASPIASAASVASRRVTERSTAPSERKVDLQRTPAVPT
ncbi:hypothetical protein Y032_0444g1567 [Ancylostoma ceylanicum]|uniref:Tetraspanin family protein n=1 Tax=Ancylostoma ceylanicum TaxID=53326 RepID=A0A016X126_9BILA|nr:hypothetical protein Y032_0444g1567 [Ancylostoma ceylanicum]